MNTYQLYKITNNINDRYYIGVHKGDIFADSYYGSGKVISQAIQKYGKDNFEQEVLAEFEDKIIAYMAEEILVDEDVVNDSRSYNLMVGGDYGPVMVGEDNYRWAGGDNNPNIICSDCGDKKGWHSSYCINCYNDKYRHSTKGNKYPELSKARMGRSNPSAKRIGQYNKDGELIRYWDTITSAAKYHNRAICSISDCLNGRTKTSAGYKWKYE